MGGSENRATPMSGWHMREYTTEMDDDWGAPISGKLNILLWELYT